MRNLDEIERRYNPERDLIPGGPQVTWAEWELKEAIMELSAEMAWEIKSLKAEIERLKQEMTR